MTFLSVDLKGVRLSTNNDFIVTPDHSATLQKDAYLECTTSSCQLISNREENMSIWGATLNFTNASGGKITLGDFAARWYGLTVTGNYGTSGLFGGTNNGAQLTCTGCDFSADPGMTWVDLSPAGDGMKIFTCVNCEFPASYNLSDGAYSSENQRVEIYNTSDSGDQWYRKIETKRGTVETVTATYRNWSDADASTGLSYRISPDSELVKGRPACTPWAAQWLDNTGTLSVTAELAHDYPALDKSEVALEVLYLDDANSTLATLVTTLDEDGTAALDAASGSWTGCAGCTTGAITLGSLSVDQVGQASARVCLHEYSAGDFLYVDPEITFTVTP